jgi:hypothetical protein
MIAVYSQKFGLLYLRGKITNLTPQTETWLFSQLTTKDERLQQAQLACTWHSP